MQTPWSHRFPVAVACGGQCSLCAAGGLVLCAQPLLLEVRTWSIFTPQKVSMKERFMQSAEVLYSPEA